jgi:hypothetical protein
LRIHASSIRNRGGGEGKKSVTKTLEARNKRSTWETTRTSSSFMLGNFSCGIHKQKTKTKKSRKKKKRKTKRKEKKRA